VADGRIITFYSYKGGTGRSMALANVAWILALSGKKVLTIDWDLEAPGLHRYFLPFLDDPELIETNGIIDLFWSYADLVLTPKESWPPGITNPFSFADAQRYAVPLEFPFQNSTSCLHFLGAGRQEPEYSIRVRSFDWTSLYARLGGSEFVERLRERLRQQYDYILIDSRTGVADTSGICTVQMPDTVVLCFTYNRQSMKGVEAVAKSILAQADGRITLLPVAMRAERSATGYDQAKLVARDLLEPLLRTQFSSEFLKLYWEACEVPSYPDYSFEETLSVFKDLPGQRNTLLGDMVWLAETIEGVPSGSLTVPELQASVREKYLRRFALRVSGGWRPLYEGKLIVLGSVGVGKTALVNRLVYNSYDFEEKATEGINITKWKLQLTEDVDVHLNIWDFGGQEIMHGTHQLFLSTHGLYLLVLNSGKNSMYVDAEYWLKLIEIFGDKSPIIVVLNKINNRPFDLNRRALHLKYPNIANFIKTDCQDGIGLVELRKTIEQELVRLPQMGASLPATWYAIKEHLVGLKDNYITHQKYQDICVQYGEDVKAAQETLADYLHNLGIVLNFKDDPRLLDTQVLNPQWLTNGIYLILSSSRLALQKGELGLNDLVGILSESDYPRETHRFVLDLMQKFDLCFSLSEDDKRYLIPELLDKQEPDLSEEFKSECLNLQYHYPVLPVGLLPRFIARTHELSEKLPRWRSGVILEFEGNRALIKADLWEKKVFISVSGPALGRRRLLAIIRSHFERIHRDIHDLQVQEMVPLPGQLDILVSYKELVALEKNGIKRFPKLMGTQVREVDVNELLNGIELKVALSREKPLSEQNQAIKLFYSYSHKDERLREELETHLKLLLRQGLIAHWFDRRIEAADDWKHNIDNNVEQADIILLLISADFIASDYCYGLEMARALSRQENGEVKIIPIILRDVNWRMAPFDKLQALPKDGKAITAWSNRDSAWKDVADGIEKVIEALRKKAMSEPNTSIVIDNNMSNVYGYSEADDEYDDDDTDDDTDDKDNTDDQYEY